MSDQRTLEEYLREVASFAPTPGGGSVTGLVGALAAALGQMVINLTPVLPHSVEDAARYRDLLEALHACQGKLLEGASADEKAYQRYRDAAALTRNTPEEKAARTQAMQKALITATEVPLAMAEEAGHLLALLVEVGQYGNRQLSSDTALAVLLAEATLRGALLNVRGNAALLKDATRAERYRLAADRLETAGRGTAATALEMTFTP